MTANKDETEFEISLVHNDLFFRLQRRIGLVPHDGLGLIRRAIFFSLLAWLPIVIWAAFTHRALPGTVGEPLLHHFGIHVRFLIAVPLLIIGEGVAHKLTRSLIPYFRTSGLITEEKQDLFRNVVRGIIHLRNSTLPWIIIAAIVVSWLVMKPPSSEIHELIWANVGEPAHFDLGFGGWWLIYVARPIFVVLLCVWLWRLILLFILLKRIASLNLAIVPTHPDRAGGLGFLEKIPLAFSLFAFAVSAVFASHLAHDVIYHGVHVQSLKLMVSVFLIVVVLLCLFPLTVFIPSLAGAKRQALLEYGALVGKQGRLVRRRWILKEAVEDNPLLDAPEIGPVADALSIYEAVANMRATPIGKSALFAILLPTAIPLLALFTIEVPIKDILQKIFGILM